MEIPNGRYFTGSLSNTTPVTRAFNIVDANGQNLISNGLPNIFANIVGKRPLLTGVTVSGTGGSNPLILAIDVIGNASVLQTLFQFQTPVSQRCLLKSPIYCPLVQNITNNPRAPGTLIVVGKAGIKIAVTLYGVFLDS